MSKHPETRSNYGLPSARLLAGLSLMGALSASILAADDSVWINKGIKDAIAQGKSEYVLPAGSINLSNQILIPDGTKNFTLRGMGKGQTLLRADNGKVGYAIRAGVPTMLHNNWGVTNQKNLLVEPVGDGDKRLKIADTTGLKAGDYVALWDKGYVEHSKYPGGDRNMNHAELAKLSSVKGEGKLVFLDRPTAREYKQTPSIALVNHLVVKNITIKDMSFDASVPGFPNVRNNGIVLVGLGEDIHLQNLDVQHFATRAVMVNWTRDVEIDGVTISDGQYPESPGSAYGVTVCRSRDVYVHDCQTTDSRHGFITHNGATDVLFEDCIADGDNGNFDTHGCDERRMTYRRCVGTGSVNFGSGAWLGGGRDFKVEDCVFGGALHYNANTTGLEFHNTTLMGISVDNPGGDKNQAVADVQFFDCNFENIPAQGLIYEGGNFSRIDFNRCSFSTGATSWGGVLTMKKIDGKLVFNDCLMVSNVTRGYVPIWISSPNLDLTLNNCEILSKFGTMTSIQFGNTFAGNAKLTGNTFYSDGKKAVFFVNDSRNPVAAERNKAMRAALMPTNPSARP